MHRFDYSFLDDGMLPAKLLNVTADIYSLRAMSWSRREQYAVIFTELAAIARVQSIKSSNAIEGIITTDQRIHEIVNGDSAPLSHGEQEIAGYRDALAEVHRGYAGLDFREPDIKRLHAIMMGNIPGYEAAVLNSLTPISKADICKILPDISPTTVEAVLGRMVREGKIQRIGVGRSTGYIGNLG